MAHATAHPPLWLYDSARRKRRPFTPRDPSRVRFYVCGPTVYDHIHIGNARTFAAFDLLFRVLRRLYGAERVTYVRNITDIDDKIIAAAERDGCQADEIARIMTRRFHDALACLGLLAPNVEPRAAEHIDLMIAMIVALIAKGCAYEAEGHVLFDVASDPDYGSLSRRSAEAMREGARVEVAPYKRNAADFVLWKPSSPTAPGWDSPWGRGRPGWHLECSAMAGHYLDPPFDLHGGGGDLIFPHHENECAQSRCAHPQGAPLADHWMHVGFLRMAAKKMSKSLGNVTTVAELAKNHSGAAIRLCLLFAHYRQPYNWREEGLREAEAILRRWRRCARPDPHDDVPDAMMIALCDDLNAPRAFAFMHRLAAAAQDGDADAAQRLGACLSLLGLDAATDPESPPDAMPADAVARIEKLIAQRADARARNAFAEADRLRDLLTSEGVHVRDTPDGVQWERLAPAGRRGDA